MAYACTREGRGVVGLFLMKCEGRAVKKRTCVTRLHTLLEKVPSLVYFTLLVCIQGVPGLYEV
jgi:hypothetical protein